MKLIYIGNFGAPHSTESHVFQALEACGHDVLRCQENHAPWRDLASVAASEAADFVLWTHTRDYAPPDTYDHQRRFLNDCPVPVVGYHLDLWWGLRRSHLVAEEPFFRVDLLVTADGGHPDEWEKAGVTHRWMPPAVSEFECQPGTPRDEYRAQVVFVGSHQGGYHPESKHRAALVKHLRRRRDTLFLPRPGQDRIVGQELRDVYASATMAVGDSCLVGTPRFRGRYWSDRIPETLGRGGCLLHPHVEGLDEHYEPGKHLLCWPAGDWRTLDNLIEHHKAYPEAAAEIAVAGREHVLQTATYTVRMRQLETLLRSEGLL